jgi:hypothetical protein
MSLVADIRDRIAGHPCAGRLRAWLGEPDPRDFMGPFPADLMRMWSISTRVNKPENDDCSILERIELATDAAKGLNLTAKIGSCPTSIRSRTNHAGPCNEPA